MTRSRVATVPRHPEAVFAVWCSDGPDAERLRETHLDGHLAHVEANHERYLVAGPLRRDGETGLCGSFFIVAADTEAEARAFMAGDPYFTCGLYERIEYRALTPAAGRWMGGVIWESAQELRSKAGGD